MFRGIYSGRSPDGVFAVCLREVDMARLVRSSIGNRTQRLKLEPRKEPYWAVLERGLSLGYHRSPRGAGAWWVRVLVTGKYRSSTLVSADDHEVADGERYLDYGQAQRAARAWADRQTGAGPLTVAAACRRHVEALRAGKGERAAYHAQSVVNRHIEPKLGKELVADLRADTLRRWRDGLVKLAGDQFDDEDERRSRDTANRILTVLKAALNRAFEDGLVKDDRAWRATKAFKAVGEPRQALLTNEEIQHLVDCCPPGLRELVAAGAYTGARLGELTSAKVSDFSAKHRTLSVRGKTGPRIVHLDVGAAALFARLTKGRGAADPLLRTAEGRPWARSWHLRPVADSIAAAKLDPATTFYALRHSYITHALNAGVPIKAVAEHCGTSVIMISRTYAKVLAGHHARYAAMAAPTLDLDRRAGNVVRLAR
jgi:integrase